MKARKITDEKWYERTWWFLAWFRSFCLFEQDINLFQSPNRLSAPAKRNLQARLFDDIITSGLPPCSEFYYCSRSLSVLAVSIYFPTLSLKKLQSAKIQSCSQNIWSRSKVFSSTIRPKWSRTFFRNLIWYFLEDLTGSIPILNGSCSWLTGVGSKCYFLNGSILERSWSENDFDPVEYDRKPNINQNCLSYDCKIIKNDHFNLFTGW